MRKTLTLSKETLRVLDDEDLARVVGGGHSGPHKTGSGKCQANKKHDDHKKHPKSKHSRCNSE